MSRIKLQYAPSEITTDLYTYGKEWMSEVGIEYIGLYHKYTTGEVYTEPVYNETTSIKLISYENLNTRKYEYKKLNPNIQTKFKSLYPIRISLTTEDIKRGYITRYFAYRQNDYTITEIDLAQYDNIGSNILDSNLYKAIKIKWYITGPKIDTSNGLVITQGVQTKNRIEVMAVENDAPGISFYLSNLTEFYMDTDFKVPADINVNLD
jgi:hypothetical protein